MEEWSTNSRRGVKKYWMKSKARCQRLIGSGGRRRSMELVVLGGPRRRSRIWGLRILKKPKLKLRLISPRKLLMKLRDAYVNFMLRLSNSSALGAGGFGGGMVDVGVAGFGRRPVKEYDEKMIVEMYKSILMRQGQLMPYNTAKISSEITSRE